MGINYSVTQGGSHSTDPNGNPWTPASLNAIRVGVDSTVPAGGTVGIRSLALQIKVAPIPVVKSVDFSPSANFEFNEGATPTVNWQYFDPTNAAQTFWEIKVFDTYTFALHGFSADTTTPIWTKSGNDASSSVTLTSTTGYQDGQQYWAFVRVGKQQNSQTVYSKWNSSIFAVTIQQPQPPMIAVQKDTDQAVNRLIIQASDNLLTDNNADFQSNKGAWVRTASDSAVTDISVAVAITTTGAALAGNSVVTSIPVGTQGTLASAIASTGLGSFTVTGTTNPGGTSHISFTATRNTSTFILTSVSSTTGIIAGMVLFGAGIPSGATVVSVGAGTITMSVKPTASGATTVVANYYNAADALGFPRSGQFWVKIDNENILVKNTMDGNNTGDSFTILQRGYKNPSTGVPTTAASHAIGATITYGLQTDVYAGTTGNITQAYQESDIAQVKKWRPIAPVRAAAGGGGSAGGAGSVDANGYLHLFITRGTAGQDASQQDRIWVNDPNGILKKGMTVKVHYGTQLTVSLTTGNANSSGNIVVTRIRTVSGAANTGGLANETAVIKSVEQGVPHVTPVLCGKFANKYSGVRGESTIKKVLIESDSNVTGSLKVGDVLRFNMNGSNNYKLPNGKSVSSVHAGDKNYYARLTKSVPALKGFVWLHIEPITNGGDFNYTWLGAKLWYMPDGTRVYNYNNDNPPAVNKKVTFTKRLSTGAWAGQQVRRGDTLLVAQASRTAVLPHNAAPLGRIITPGYNQAYYDPTVNTKQIFNSQSFTVGYKMSASDVTNISGATLGYMVSGTFTPMTSNGATNGGIFTTIRCTGTATANQYQGKVIEANGTPFGATVASNTATAGGTFLITLSAAGAQVSDGTNSVNVTNYYTTSDVTMYPAGSNVIPAGSTTLPVLPFTVNANYLKYSLMSLHYPSRFGENVLLLDPSASGSVCEVSTRPTAWTGWSNDNSLGVSVNAGQIYGFAGFTQVVKGGLNTPKPKVNYYIDWYDDYGNLILSSDGTTSLSGVVHSFDPAITIGSSTDVGDGWTPNAIVAKAPADFRVATLASYSVVSGNSGVYSITSGTLGINLAAGTYIYSDRWAIVTTAVNAGASSVSVRFPYTTPPTAGSTSPLYISATRAVPRIRITNSNINDTYALSGLMFKALQAPSVTGYTNLNTYIPALSAGTNASDNATGSKTFVIPATTDTSGADSLYLFDPTNDLNSREIQEGAGTPALWTRLSISAGSGSTSLVLNSVLGLGVNGLLIVGKGSSIEESVTITSDWSGSNVVTLKSPLWYSHGAGSYVYAQTNAIVGSFNVQQAINTPVAVFNWNNDGYINTPSTGYFYKVEKSEDYGNTWRTLYGGSSVIADPTGVAQITDFEVTPNTLTYYRATPTFINQNAHATTGIPNAPLAAEILTTSTWWLSSSSDETLRYPVLVQNGVQETQRHPGGVFYPLGSSRPIVTPGVVTGRDGSIKIIWTDDKNWKNFLSLLNMGETLVLTNPVENDRRYIYINSDVSYTHQSAAIPYREVDISFVEVAPPQGFGYTYGS